MKKLSNSYLTNTYANKNSINESTSKNRVIKKYNSFECDKLYAPTSDFAKDS